MQITDTLEKLTRCGLYKATAQLNGEVFMFFRFDSEEGKITNFITNVLDFQTFVDDILKDGFLDVTPNSVFTLLDWWYQDQ